MGAMGATRTFFALLHPKLEMGVSTGRTGVSLLEQIRSGWRLAAVAPSYETFVELSQGTAVDWNAKKFTGSRPRIAEVLQAARKLTSAEIGVVAVDMPVATVRFDSRREADSAISRAFGGRGCSAHSPSAERPGSLGASVMAQLECEGFPLATTCRDSQGRAACTIEVYPHPALLVLLSRGYRVCYKVSRSLKYWKGTSVSERIRYLLQEFRQIQAALQSELGPLTFELPRTGQVSTLSKLKRYEDALDAIVCGWVGSRYLDGRADAYGDLTSTIWVPNTS
jgi:predicted RNase H-like nuclease